MIKKLDLYFVISFMSLFLKSLQMTVAQILEFLSLFCNIQYFCIIWIPCVSFLFHVILNPFSLSFLCFNVPFLCSTCSSVLYRSHRLSFPISSAALHVSSALKFVSIAFYFLVLIKYFTFSSNLVTLGCLHPGFNTSANLTTLIWFLLKCNPHCF